MRPNCPLQIAQRWAVPLPGFWGPLRIVASCGPCVGSGWYSSLVRRTSRRRAEARLGRNDLPSLAAYKDTVSKASLSCAVSLGEAAAFFADPKGVCRGGDSYVVQSRGLTAVALNLFDRDRRRAVTCNRLFRLAVRLRGLRLMAQSYLGKRAVSKRIGRLYGSLWCVPASPCSLRGSGRCPRKSMDG